MKPVETFLKGKKRYLAIALLCFLYGGFSIIMFLSQAYEAFWIREFAEPSAIEGRGPDFNRFPEPDFNKFQDVDFNRLGRPGRIMRNPWSRLADPLPLISLIGGIVSIFAGIAIWNLLREKEIKSIKQQTANNLLLPDEKAVIEALKRSGNELTQAKLAKETGLNKVQVHRVIKRLESKGILSKHSYGLTNKIILNKEVFE